MSTRACPARKHGVSRRAYDVHGCRCPRPRAANSRHCARRRAHSRGIHYGGRVSTRDAANPEDVRICLERSLRREPAPLRTAELHAAIDVLDTQGLSARAIALRLGVADRTVTRQRARRRAGGGS